MHTLRRIAFLLFVIPVVLVLVGFIALNPQRVDLSLLNFVYIELPLGVLLVLMWLFGVAGGWLVVKLGRVFSRSATKTPRPTTEVSK